ncbi:MAG: alpha-amylase, partial [Paeniglutamicibacter terrestris]
CKARETNFGFGAAPWLPQPAWFAEHAFDAQEAVPGSTLELYRSALTWRRRLQTHEELSWISAPAATLAHYERPNGWAVLTNFGAAPVDLPPAVDERKIVVSSGATNPGPGQLAGETTIWIAP